MIRNILLLFLAMLVLALLSGCIMNPSLIIRGEGKIVSRSFETSNFTGIVIGGSAEIVFRYSD